VVLGPPHSSGGYSSVSQRGGLGSIPGQGTWRWGSFPPSTSISLANYHSINCSPIIDAVSLNNEVKIPSWLFSVPPGKCWDSILNQDTNDFSHALSNSLLTKIISFDAVSSQRC
jgi:hypothetical protein